ncbi:hypothetical protein Cgig2_025154 [Carnegiea gigantea]|uniref:Peptidase A1 domain-containing protein n=1 Tax=Carnegiea gigantea TaxID=171969 RepID=A0A9Q1QQ44_9CARY|nr:hypothetical protein Cgig2_025154 [Carnegiea gigantea]
MAEPTLFLLTLFSLLAFSPLTSPRHLPPTFKTCTLNIASSLYPPSRSPSLTNQSQPRIHSPAKSSSLTLKIHSRDSLFSSDPHHAQTNYKSRLLARLARDSARVNSLQARLDLAVLAYGDGSFTAGDFVTETLTFSGAAAAVDNVAVGCGHSNEGLFIGAGGLLGLGGGALSLPSQLNATSFSYCLVDRDSDSASVLEFRPAESPSLNSVHSVSAQLIKNPQMDSFYYVGLTGIAVGGNPLELPAKAFQIDGDGNGGVIVDSGTAVTRLESATYESLRDEFRRLTSHLASAEGVAIFDTCYDLSGQTSVEVPEVELVFASGKRLTLPAKNYMIPVDSEGTFCLAFAGTTSSMSIIGNVQQQGTRVGFDLANQVVTFEPNRC